MHKARFLIFMLAVLLTVGFSEFACAAGVDYDALRASNGGKTAETLRFVDTTEKAVVYTFGGLSRQSSVQDILQRMSDNGMGGTFFVTERELKRNADTVQMIVNYGQELGIGISGSSDKGFGEYCAEIDRIQDIMQQRYGVRPKFVRQMFGEDSSDLREAVSAMGCVLIGQTVNVVQSRDKNATCADDIMPLIFGKWAIAMGRGQVVYIRTDFYNNEKLAGDMMMAIKKAKIDNVAYRTSLDTPETNPNNDTEYIIRGVASVYDSPRYRYTYPITSKMMPMDLRPENHWITVNDSNFSKLLKARYIGAPDVDAGDRVYGFSIGEINSLDKSGVVKNVRDNTIFLTFDDWASDQSLNRLLYVLRKHNVKATFFIITKNMVNNRNLLRVIAQEGHEIASHTDQHVPMSNNWFRQEGDNRVQSAAEYAQDVSAAYAKLAAVVGDVQVDGKYSLTRFLRPPTLAISKSGVKSIFNAGYEYIVSGYESTEDYGAESRQVMVAGLQHGVYKENGDVRPGSIIIMHMSDTAKYTAEALDVFLTANEQLPNWDPRKFKVGLLGDYLCDGYSQAQHSYSQGGR